MSLHRFDRFRKDDITFSIRLFWALIMLISLAALYNFDPATDSRFPRCPFFAATGLHCPGCGSLRALHALLHGHLTHALRLNPLMIIIAPFLVLSSIRCDRLRSALGSSFLVPVFRTLGPYVPLIIVGYGVIRNFPIFPFNLLTPIR
jgi:hypothetical protein